MTDDRLSLEQWDDLRERLESTDLKQLAKEDFDYLAPFFSEALVEWISQSKTPYPGLPFSLEGEDPRADEVIAFWKQHKGLATLAKQFPSVSRMFLLRCIVAAEKNEDTVSDSALGKQNVTFHAIETLDDLQPVLKMFRMHYFVREELRQSAVCGTVAAICEFLENSDVPSEDLVPLQHLRDALNDLVRGRECHFFDPPKPKAGRKKKSSLDQRVFVLASVFITLAMRKKNTEKWAGKTIAELLDQLDLQFPTAQKIRAKSSKETEPWQRLLDWRDGLLQSKQGVSALKMYERELNRHPPDENEFARAMVLKQLCEQCAPRR